MLTLTILIIITLIFITVPITIHAIIITTVTSIISLISTITIISISITTVVDITRITTIVVIPVSPAAAQPTRASQAWIQDPAPGVPPQRSLLRPVVAWSSHQASLTHSCIPSTASMACFLSIFLPLSRSRGRKPRT